MSPTNRQKSGPTSKNGVSYIYKNDRTMTACFFVIPSFSAATTILFLAISAENQDHRLHSVLPNYGRTFDLKFRVNNIQVLSNSMTPDRAAPHFIQDAILITFIHYTPMAKPLF